MTATAERQEGAASLRGEELRTDGEASTILVDLVSAVYRLVKLTRMYEENNQALMTGADALVAAVQAFCGSYRVASADLMFASETVFVDGQMPRLSREAYGRAMELGELLDKAGVSSLTIPRGATAADLVAFLRVLVAATRDPGRQPELTDKAGIRGIRARKLRRTLGAASGEGDRSPAGRVVRTYACAIVLLRRFHADLAKGRTEKVPPGIGRIAQRIVTHAEEESGLLVALAAARARENDDANVAVATALVAVLMARLVTRDRSALSNLVQAALLYHLGHARLVTLRGESIAATVSPLSEDEQDRLPASGAASVAALEKMDVALLPRTVMAFEAQWARRAGRIGPLYRGKRAASVLGRILWVARSFAELMAPGPYAAAMGPEDAIHFLGGRVTDENERAFVKLLTGALGIFPPGTMVELTTGEVGVVMRVPSEPAEFSRPPVRVMYDDAGNLLASPFDVDLASPIAWGATQRLIRRSVEADQQQTQSMRAYVLSVTRGETTEQRKLSRASDSQSGKRPAGPSRPDLNDVETGILRAPPPPVSASVPPSAVPASAPVARPGASAPAVTPPLAQASAPPSVPLAFPSVPLSASGSAPASSGSVTARRRRSFDDRPKVRDPRAEPDDDPPSPAVVPPRVVSRPSVTSRAAVPAPPPESGPVKRGQEGIPTQPAMAAVRPPTDVHEKRTLPPPADLAPSDETPTRGFAWEPPRDSQRSANPPVAKSTTAGTRKVDWADYGKVVGKGGEPAEPARPTPSRRFDAGAYDDIVDDEEKPPKA